MSNLYEKIKLGDRRTIVKKFPKGEKLRYTDGSVIMLKSHVAMKVTQEFDSAMGRGEWVDKTYDLASMVEIETPYERPEPTTLPRNTYPDPTGPMKPLEAELPRAEITPWWKRWFW